MDGCRTEPQKFSNAQSIDANSASTTIVSLNATEPKESECAENTKVEPSEKYIELEAMSTMDQSKEVESHKASPNDMNRVSREALAIDLSAFAMSTIQSTMDSMISLQKGGPVSSPTSAQHNSADELNFIWARVLESIENILDENSQTHLQEFQLSTSEANKDSPFKTFVLPKVQEVEDFWPTSSSSPPRRSLPQPESSSNQPFLNTCARCLPYSTAVRLSKSIPKSKPFELGLLDLDVSGKAHARMSPLFKSMMQITPTKSIKSLNTRKSRVISESRTHMPAHPTGSLSGRQQRHAHRRYLQSPQTDTKANIRCVDNLMHRTKKLRFGKFIEEIGLEML